MWSIPATHPTIVPHSSRIIVVAKPLGSHNHCRNNPSPKNFSGNPYFDVWTLHQDRPSLSSPPVQKYPASGSSCVGPRAAAVLHASARDSFFSHRTLPPESSAADLLAYLTSFLLQHLNLHFFLYFVSGRCTFLGFLDFSNTQ